MSEVYTFNQEKKWKFFANNIESISGDDLTLKVTGSNKIKFIQNDISYGLENLINTETIASTRSLNTTTGISISYETTSISELTTDINTIVISDKNPTKIFSATNAQLTSLWENITNNLPNTFECLDVATDGSKIDVVVGKGGVYYRNRVISDTSWTLARLTDDSSLNLVNVDFSLCNPYESDLSHSPVSVEYLSKIKKFVVIGGIEKSAGTKAAIYISTDGINYTAKRNNYWNYDFYHIECDASSGRCLALVNSDNTTSANTVIYSDDISLDNWYTAKYLTNTSGLIDESQFFNITISSIIANTSETNRYRSSSWDNNHMYSTIDNTLGNVGGWVPAAGQFTGSYLQLDLGTPKTIVGVVTQGRGIGPNDVDNQYVSIFRLETGVFNSSTQAITWADRGSYTANYDRDSKVYNYFLPIKCRYVKFYPTSWNFGVGLRADVMLPTYSPISLDLGIEKLLKTIEYSGASTVSESTVQYSLDNSTWSYINGGTPINGSTITVNPQVNARYIKIEPTSFTLTLTDNRQIVTKPSAIGTFSLTVSAEISSSINIYYSINKNYFSSGEGESNLIAYDKSNNWVICNPLQNTNKILYSVENSDSSLIFQNTSIQWYNTDSSIINDNSNIIINSIIYGLDKYVCLYRQDISTQSDFNKGIAYSTNGIQWYIPDVSLIYGRDWKDITWTGYYYLASGFQLNENFNYDFSLVENITVTTIGQVSPYYKFNGISGDEYNFLRGVKYNFIRQDTGHAFYISDNGVGQVSQILSIIGDGSATTGITVDQSFYFTIPLDFSGTITYYCTAHSNMNKILNILDVSKSGILAVSTDGINWNNLKIQGVSFENFRAIDSNPKSIIYTNREYYIDKDISNTLKLYGKLDVSSSITASTYKATSLPTQITEIGYSSEFTIASGTSIPDQYTSVATLATVVLQSGVYRLDGFFTVNAQASNYGTTTYITEGGTDLARNYTVVVTGGFTTSYISKIITVSPSTTRTILFRGSVNGNAPSAVTTVDTGEFNVIRIA